MGLKAVVETLDEVPEDLRTYYAQGDDGRYFLDVDAIEEHPGARALKRALDAERETRKRAVRKAEALRAEFERQGGAESEADAATPRPADDESLTSSRAAPLDPAVRAFVEDRLDQLEAARRHEIGALRKAFEAAEQSAAGARDQLEREKLDNLILQAAADAGVRRAALPDVLARARQTWRLDKDGTPVAYKQGKPLVGPDGEAPLTIEAWLTALAQSAQHLFEPNRGGAAAGSGISGTSYEIVIDGARTNAIGENLEAFAKGEARIT